MTLEEQQSCDPPAPPRSPRRARVVCFRVVAEQVHDAVLQRRQDASIPMNHPELPNGCFSEGTLFRLVQGEAKRETTQIKWTCDKMSSKTRATGFCKRAPGLGGFPEGKQPGEVANKKQSCALDVNFTSSFWKLIAARVLIAYFQVCRLWTYSAE